MDPRLEARRPDGCHTTREVADALGLSLLTLNRWVRCGHVTLEQQGNGSGYTWWWTDEEIAQARRIVARLDWGMTLDAAARHDDPPMPGARVLLTPHCIEVDGTSIRFADDDFWTIDGERLEAEDIACRTTYQLVPVDVACRRCTGHGELDGCPTCGQLVAAHLTPADTPQGR